MMTSTQTASKNMDHFLDIYQSDDQLIRFANKFKKLSMNMNAEEAEKMIIDDIFDAYWQDIGGEGA